MRTITFLFFIFYLFAGCKPEAITRENDYVKFFENTGIIENQLLKSSHEIQFWEDRLKNDTGSFVNILKLAANHAKRFKINGSIADILIADSFYQRSIQIAGSTDPEIYFSLSQNNILQHRFQDAWQNLLDADSIGVNPYTLQLLKFDAAMEIGHFGDARKNLECLKDKKSFDYLIRKAKMEDHEGRLDNAISFMEKALRDAEQKKNRELILWAKSNLADMYGHAGKVAEAYQNYLSVLNIDSNYLYALKGIAWIAYSHDHNTAAAKKIINYILSQTSMPDLYLVLAEIAKWEGNTAAHSKYLSEFKSIVEKPGFGNMYNKYLIELYADEFNKPEKALAIAEKEIQSRPTPETYSWLSWVYYKMGNYKKAYELLNKFVLGRDFEPRSQMYAAYILRSNGENDKADKLFKLSLESAFELGPVTTERIKESF